MKEGNRVKLSGDIEPRRYGSWAGNPKGTKEDVQLCVKEVWHNMMAAQCARKRGHGPNGLYCKQHAKTATELGGVDKP